MEITAGLLIYLIIKVTVFMLALMFSISLARDILVCHALTVKDAAWKMPGFAITFRAVLWGIFVFMNYLQPYIF
ncbi:hypothetical protein KY334_01700 [Candidatus Woesearchaeota archaeon]|nr:hypothetical protein [Candidatus Woesearchaeota archaeon]